ncbi:leucine-rich repeat domain-containing protein [Paenibacillus sp. GXUN7292]|uniref:leucine-rich repeat domain-containing protein n=1 Tax=Paenibacillus sp. GXUN7292 TaxID=3422499 RepID=UPI003D7E0DCF
MNRRFRSSTICSFLLALCLFVSLLPQAAIAKASPDPHLEYADRLNILGIFAGTNKGYELDRKPTRLEGLVMLIRMLGVEAEAQKLQNDPSPFIDVPRWGIGYVNYAYSHQLANGVSASRFGSNDPMSAIQYVTLVLRALGYNDNKGDFTYAQSLNKAASIGLINSATSQELAKQTFLRGHIALLSFEALKQPLKQQEMTLAGKLIAEGVFTEEATNRAGVLAQGAGADTDVVTFSDPGLEQVVRAAAGKPTGDLYRSDVNRLTRLSSVNVPHTRIRSLDGIQALQKLTRIELPDNLIKDLSPLSSLRELQELVLHRNSIEDLSPLSSLSNLEGLFVSHNFITRLDALSSLTKLESLNIASNAVTSIKELQKLKQLSYLEMNNNAVSDISVIADLPLMDELNVDGNPVIDMSFVKGMNYLGSKSAASTQELGLKAREIIQSIIRPGMSELEKETAVHDYILSRTQYDHQEFSKGIPTASRPYDAYGALIEQYAVCDGYARAMQMLGKLAGLDIYYIDGISGSGHAWNLIRLNGEFYHVDATWNDSDNQWNGAAPSNAVQAQLLDFGKRNYFNQTQTARELSIAWDFDRFPKAKTDSPSPANQQITVSINAETPLKNDLIVWLTVSVEVEGDVTKGLSRDISKAVLFPYNKESVDVMLNVPSELPLAGEGVTFTVDYKVFSTEYFFQEEDNHFLHRNNGLTFMPKRSNVLQPNDHLYVTLLKKGSKGITFNQAASQGKLDSYALNQAMFSYSVTPVANSYPPSNKYSVRNVKEITLPAHSAIYVTEVFFGADFDDKSWNYLYGESAIAVNHSNQPKVLAPGDLQYTLRPSPEPLKRNAEVYFRLSVFDGAFDELNYENELREGRILFKDEWVHVVD